MRALLLKLGFRGWLALITGLLFCGFFAPLKPSPRLPSNALPVPIVRQSTTYSCGPASLLAILQYWKKTDETESSLFGPLNTTPKDGTTPQEMVKVARAFGLTARLQQHTTLNDLRKGLRLGETILLDIQAWHDEGDTTPWADAWEDGHYVVLVGMDSSYAYFMDPSVGTGYTYLPLREVEERWHDYENRTGVINRYFQLALFMKGTDPMPRFPAALSLTE